MQRVWYLLAIWMAYCSNAAATSCVPLTDRIIGWCDAGRCTQVFQAREVPGYGMCSRRPLVEAAPEWAIQALEYEVSMMDSGAVVGAYELAVQARFWSREQNVNDIFDYLELKSPDGYSGYFRATVTSLGGVGVPDLQREWVIKQEEGYRKNIASMLIDWGVAFVAAIALAYSVQRFRMWLLKGAGYGELAKAFIIQISLFMALSVSPLDYSSLAPIVVLIVWMYEIAFSIAVKARSLYLKIRQS